LCSFFVFVSLTDVPQLIDKQTHQRQQQQQQPEKSYGGLERSEDYYLIVRANNTAVEIDNELLLLHKVRLFALDKNDDDLHISSD